MVILSEDQNSHRQHGTQMSQSFLRVSLREMVIVPLLIWLWIQLREHANRLANSAMVSQPGM